MKTGDRHFKPSSEGIVKIPKNSAWKYFMILWRFVIIFDSWRQYYIVHSPLMKCFIIFRECILFCIRSVYWALFSVKHNNIPINSLTYHTVHNWVYWSCNVAACFDSRSHPQTIHQQPDTIELWILYGSIYFSRFSWSPICAQIVFYCFKNALKQVFNPIKVF
jgi:hypothetical protein